MARGGFPFGGGANMQQLIKQAQKMQQDVQRVQEELENKEVEASAGGGAVRVVMNGKKKLIAVEIKPEAVDPDDVEMLQDLIIAAVNEAAAKADEMSEREMSRVTGGMGGMF